LSFDYVMRQNRGLLTDHGALQSRRG
jgi:hypothetical protein